MLVGPSSCPSPDPEIVRSPMILPDFVVGLRKKFPGIIIEIVATNSLSDLRQREADIAIRNAEPTDPYVSPLFGDYSGIPPLLVQVGDHEILLDDSKRLADRARQHGCKVELSVWPEMPHVFQLFSPDLPQAQQAMDDVGRFFAAAVGR